MLSTEHWGTGMSQIVRNALHAFTKKGTGDQWGSVGDTLVNTHQELSQPQEVTAATTERTGQG